MILFEKEYYGESLYDLSRDVYEGIDSRYNSLVEEIPQDKHGFLLGTFKIAIEWIEE